jgi:predicted GNAT family acetyltransferase
MTQDDDALIEVVDNRAAHRFEARRGNHVAGFVMYRTESDVLVLVHTEVNDAFRGLGVATRLATEVLDDARRRGIKIVPLCPFIASFIERHPAYADLVAPD